jgi:universal stress protein A
MLKPTKILVPTDFSEFSDKALKQALDIGRQYKAKVYLLHVIPSMAPYAIDYAVTAEAIMAAENQAQDASSENIAAQLAKYPPSEEVEIETSIVTGVPAETILKVAEEQGVDLIVIASLGRSGIAKYLIGGVARNILKGAKCPVLLTK